MYSTIVLMVIGWHYRMLFDANGCVSMLVNVNWLKWMYLVLIIVYFMVMNSNGCK